MAKTRPAIPKATRESVIGEFNHRCAICGADKPQVHHIDENPENNDRQNLLPLCPNCHLTDQHNPTAPIDPRKLSLFRKFKDPLIFCPQFEPLFKRFLFLLPPDNDSFLYAARTDRLEEIIGELIDFVSVLELGEFFSKELAKQLNCPPRPPIAAEDLRDLSHKSSSSILQKSAEDNERHRKQFTEKVLRASARVQELIMELIRYQNWKPPRKTKQ